MKKINLSVLLLLSCVYSFCQSNISIGETAPEIHVTDWVLNEPEDKNFSDKFIVLEFWATWCGPCIAAVPHMNELQDQFQREDLYFISATDESLAKINRTIDRIPFKSIVVSDQSKQTHISFGDGKEGLEAYPMTILIDKKGIVQWIGEPMQLTPPVMKDFLAGNLKGVNHLAEIAESEAEEKEMSEGVEKTHMVMKDFFKLIKDQDVPYAFELSEVESDDEMSMKTGKHIFYMESFSLSKIYKEVFGLHVQLSDEMETKRYKILYKNLEPDENSLAKLEREILESLDLEKEVRTEEKLSYVISIANAKRLTPALEKMFSSKSDADDKLIFTSYTIEDLLLELSKDFGTSYHFEAEDKEKYDFIIDVDSVENTSASLESYGLSVEQKNISKEIIELKRN